MSMGSRIKKLRKERKLTQIQVSNALGFSRSVYSQYENDEREPSLARIISIASFFMVSIDYLCETNENCLLDISKIDKEDKGLIINILRKYY